jgi:hypothetical protein
VDCEAAIFSTVTATYSYLGTVSNASRPRGCFYDVGSQNVYLNEDTAAVFATNAQYGGICIVSLTETSVGLSGGTVYKTENSV